MSKKSFPVRMEHTLFRDIEKIAEEHHVSTNQVIVEALKTYRDLEYMETKATIINEEIYNAIRSLVEVMENRINNKTNQVLSATAIELGTLTQVIAHSLDVDPEELDIYRKNSVSFLKANQRVLKLKEVSD